MKKKIIVACAGAVATSLIVAKKVEELCGKNGIEAEIIHTRVADIEAELSETDLIITTVRAKKEYGVPLINGMSFITGVGVETMEKEVLDILC